MNTLQGLYEALIVARNNVVKAAARHVYSTDVTSETLAELGEALAVESAARKRFEAALVRESDTRITVVP